MPRLLLAPMEGLVDAVMRDVLTRVTPYDWCVTEFVRVSNTVLPSRVYTRVAPELLAGARTPAGTLVRVQLLGSDPERMGACAEKLARLQPAGIDLNFGCPAPMVNRHGGGSVLLDEPERLFRIVQAVRTGISGRVPLTAKMRLGVRDTHRAIEAAQALADGGAELLVVHARTKEEGYRPPAHWPWIARIAEAVKIPVVANGEVWTVEDYRRCVAESGCRQLMLGRGAVADPFLAERIRASEAGQAPSRAEDDWARLLPLIGHFWQGVLHKVEQHHAPGRIKQWLNFLRRTFPQAELLHQQVRPLRTAHDVEAALRAAGAC
ncbi:tRNA-dihydrouridine synthase family protein [Uliginosibacterium sp. 31-16]|uniref:tRNA dihydrouridine synthase n=1 Tax=Uliginosibacterium sp. 31-16 TaxID=3068315 RepID=UPI00273F4468|nr:tRNA-dihydrouridine synthase family protein [Uliginosibacterium sp. 31-16]MDP5241354.1 tRNA-dihydrouridine synthase family protein [Uliginosibacterium sp. 31-16]